MQKTALDLLKNADPPIIIPAHAVKLFFKAVLTSVVAFNLLRTMESMSMLAKYYSQLGAKNSLELTADGLEIHSTFKFITSGTAYNMLWKDVEEFKAGKNGMIYIRFNKEHLISKINRFTFGGDDSFDNIYRIKTRQLIDLLNFWCKRHHSTL